MYASCTRGHAVSRKVSLRAAAVMPVNTPSVGILKECVVISQNSASVCVSFLHRYDCHGYHQHNSREDFEPKPKFSFVLLWYDC